MILALFFPQFLSSSYDIIFLLWLLCLGLIAFVLMGYDKLASKMMKRTRVQEKNLWLVALLGGFIGVEVGAIVFHHKVSKMSFWPPIILATIGWIIGILYFSKIIF